MSGWLVVRSADRTVALPVALVEELVPVPAALPVPAVVAALRGVAPFRGRLVPLVHLAAAVGDGPPPPATTPLAVAVRLGGWRVLLEVDEATELTGAAEQPLPRGWQGRWASGAVRHGGRLVPILDPAWLAERLTKRAESATA